MEFIRRLESFLQLKTQLQTLDKEQFDEIKVKANTYNPWFTSENIDFAFEGIVHLLNEKDLRQWLNQYSFDNTDIKNVGIIAAGNIPMVGFHDILCVLLSGHNLHLKLSHQDTILLPFILDQLIKIDNGWKDKIFMVEKLNDIDALIATGSDNSARYFEYYFRHIPILIRKNRTSIAILSGDESTDELPKLGDDIYQFFGFGCRNVSKILLPEKYELPYLLDQFNHWAHLADYHKFVNNYNYHRAIFSMERIPYLDNGFSIFTRSPNLVSPTSVIYYDFYSSKKELDNYVAENKDKIQCIVSGKVNNAIPFGKAQTPDVSEYADHVDTLKYLLSI